MSEPTDRELSLKLAKARWQVLERSPFYGQLLMNLTDSLGNCPVPTACTDGKTIVWHKPFLASLNLKQVQFVLLHEMLHCAYGHLWRFPVGKVDHKRANVACDNAINLQLLSCGLDLEMPDGGLADEQYKGLAEEIIYGKLGKTPENKLPQDTCGDYGKPADSTDGQGQGQGQQGQQDKQGKGQGKGKPDKAQSGQGQGQGNQQGQTPSQTQQGQGQGGQESLRDAWQRKLVQAAQAHKLTACGDLPGDMQRELERITTARIDWRSELVEFVKTAVSSRLDWTRSTRRNAWQPMIYPRRNRQVGTIIFCRDTSGSISERECSEFSALVSQCLAETGCKGILMDVDTDIARELVLQPGDDCPLDACGGGGTDFRKPFARAKELTEQGEQLAGLVYLTDLYGPQPDPADVELPTLWICTNGQTAKSGRTIRLW